MLSMAREAAQPRLRSRRLPKRCREGQAYKHREEGEAVQACPRTRIACSSARPGSTSTAAQTQRPGSIRRADAATPVPCAARARAPCSQVSTAARLSSPACMCSMLRDVSLGRATHETTYAPKKTLMNESCKGCVALQRIGTADQAFISQLLAQLVARLRTAAPLRRARFRAQARTPVFGRFSSCSSVSARAQWRPQASFRRESATSQNRLASESSRTSPQSIDQKVSLACCCTLAVMEHRFRTRTVGLHAQA